MRVLAVYDDLMTLDLVAHFLGIATHDNDNAAPSAIAALEVIWNAPSEVVHPLDMIIPNSGRTENGRKQGKPEDTVVKLRQVEVLQGQGKSVADAVRQIGVTAQTYYRWRKESGGMNREVQSG